MTLKAPFPYFGGKRVVADSIWRRLGDPKHYIEPFCGSAAVLLARPGGAGALEVVGDTNGFIANFWRAVKCQPGAVAEWADYPVSHVDLGARHVWLMEQRGRLEAELADALWPGDAQVAGWWLWGQCSWIGSGWCEWGKVPHLSDAGMGIQAVGQVPHLSDAGMGIQAVGKVPHLSDAGRGDLLTSSGRVAWEWLHKLAARLERVRVVHGAWDRCLNSHYGGTDTSVFLDPPYRAYEGLYGSGAASTADVVAEWAHANEGLRIALCGHEGDYDLPGWDVVRWKRPRRTYSGGDTSDREALWFSPGCLPGADKPIQSTLFDTEVLG